MVSIQWILTIQTLQVRAAVLRSQVSKGVGDQFNLSLYDMHVRHRQAAAPLPPPRAHTMFPRIRTHDEDLVQLARARHVVVAGRWTRADRANTVLTLVGLSAGWTASGGDQVHPVRRSRPARGDGAAQC